MTKKNIKLWRVRVSFYRRRSRVETRGETETSVSSVVVEPAERKSQCRDVIVMCVCSPVVGRATRGREIREGRNVQTGAPSNVAVWMREGENCIWHNVEGSSVALRFSRTPQNESVEAIEYIYCYVSFFHSLHCRNEKVAARVCVRRRSKVLGAKCQRPYEKFALTELQKRNNFHRFFFIAASRCSIISVNLSRVIASR